MSKYYKEMDKIAIAGYRYLGKLILIVFILSLIYLLFQKQIYNLINKKIEGLESNTETITISGTGTLTQEEVNSKIGSISKSINVVIENYTIIDANALTYGNLVQVTIPNTVTKLGREAVNSNQGTGPFYGCTNLNKVIFQENSQLTFIGITTFYRCFALKMIILPNTVTHIGFASFQLSGLTSITIPDSVTSIKSFAFADCPELEDVYFEGTSKLSIDDIFSSWMQIFRNSPKLKTIYCTSDTLNKWGISAGSNKTLGSIDNLTIVVKDATAAASKTPITDANIKQAVNDWVNNPTQATTKYGHIKDWDTSAVTDMASLFEYKNSFNDDISGWNVSNVKNMSVMFNSAYAFNQDISRWDVSNVTNMYGMFNNAFKFNQPIGNWNVSNVTNMSNMFFQARVLNQDIRGWDVSKVTNMDGMFNMATKMIENQGAPANPTKAYFNQSGSAATPGAASKTPITQANIHQAVNDWVNNPTQATTKYGHISNWDTSAVTNMGSLFQSKTTFNDNISGWNVSNVTNMWGMFYNAEAFNQSIGEWNVSKVTDMGGMFNNAYVFNQPIGNWNVSNVTNMSNMFYQDFAFNQDIRGWDVSKVTNMDGMFSKGPGGQGNPPTKMMQNQGAPATPTKAYFNQSAVPTTTAGSAATTQTPTSTVTTNTFPIPSATPAPAPFNFEGSGILPVSQLISPDTYNPISSSAPQEDQTKSESDVFHAIQPSIVQNLDPKSVVGDPIYYQPGTVKYKGLGYTPSYSEMMYLNNHVYKSTPETINQSGIKGFCNHSDNIMNNIDEKCKTLPNDVCAATECCVLFGGEKCVEGDNNGPKNKMVYSNTSIKNRDVYYYQGDCYGNCPANTQREKLKNSNNYQKEEP